MRTPVAVRDHAHDIGGVVLRVQIQRAFTGDSELNTGRAAEPDDGDGCAESDEEWSFHAWIVERRSPSRVHRDYQGPVPGLLLLCRCHAVSVAAIGPDGGDAAGWAPWEGQRAAGPDHPARQPFWRAPLGRLPHDPPRPSKPQARVKRAEGPPLRAKREPERSGG